MFDPITLGGILAGIISAIVLVAMSNSTPVCREGGLEIAETHEVLVLEPQPSI